jgi:hypothetical protein
VRGDHNAAGTVVSTAVSPISPRPSMPARDASTHILERAQAGCQRCVILTGCVILTARIPKP